MARIRKFAAYRRLERPYTRISKFKKKSYIKANPRVGIIKFAMGNPKKKFPYQLELVSKQDLQIRGNALESARMSCNRVLESRVGKTGYHFKVRVYPFHILRENPLAAGAGADRFSTGMKHSFGKAIGNAARIKKGKAILSVGVNKPNIKTAREALKRAQGKLPCSCTIQLKEAK
jgi:large subunit ribosomal protein L10e